MSRGYSYHVTNPMMHVMVPTVPPTDRQYVNVKKYFPTTTVAAVKNQHLFNLVFSVNYYSLLSRPV